MFCVNNQALKSLPKHYVCETDEMTTEKEKVRASMDSL